MFYKYLYKFFNKKKYQQYKKDKRISLDKKIFQDNFEKKINLIQQKIKNQSHLNFKHSGHIGDIINILPIIKKLSKSHKCNLYIQLNTIINDDYPNHPAGKFLLNDKIYQMLLPLLRKQLYINEIDKYNNQKIDIDFDILRKIPINLLFDNMRYGMLVAGVQPNLNESFLDVEDNSKFIDKIIILRSLRYQNQFINYSFLNNYKNLIYVGTIDEYKDLKKDLNNLDFYECKDFLDMAMIIKSCKIFIGNSSLGFDIAEALKVPRLLEASPYFPARQVHGENGFDFYFQSHFENYFNILFNKINN